jgi:hypothetical protein
MSATLTIEQRVTQLETQLAQLQQDIQPTPAPTKPWWEEIVGVFENDPDFEAAVELGREYRQSLKPSIDEQG